MITNILIPGTILSWNVHVELIISVTDVITFLRQDGTLCHGGYTKDFNDYVTLENLNVLLPNNE